MLLGQDDKGCERDGGPTRRGGGIDEVLSTRQGRLQTAGRGRERGETRDRSGSCCFGVLVVVGQPGDARRMMMEIPAWLRVVVRAATDRDGDCYAEGGTTPKGWSEEVLRCAETVETDETTHPLQRSTDEPELDTARNPVGRRFE